VNGTSIKREKPDAIPWAGSAMVFVSRAPRCYQAALFGVWWSGRNTIIRGSWRPHTTPVPHRVQHLKEYECRPCSGCGQQNSDLLLKFHAIDQIPPHVFSERTDGCDCFLQLFVSDVEASGPIAALPTFIKIYPLAIRWVLLGEIISYYGLLSGLSVSSRPAGTVEGSRDRRFDIPSRLALAKALRLTERNSSRA